MNSLNIFIGQFKIMLFQYCIKNNYLNNFIEDYFKIFNKQFLRFLIKVRNGFLN